MSIWTFVLLALAVYRVAHMIVREDGPVDLFAWWRGVVGQSNWIGRGLHCVLCVSYWLSTVAFFWTFETGGILLALIYWHAVAGTILILHKILDRQPAPINFHAHTHPVIMVPKSDEDEPTQP